MASGLLIAWLVGFTGIAAVVSAQEGAGRSALAFRAPAVPLVTHDPYFSVWSFSDRLTDSWPVHWTGKTMGMCGMARIDGKTWRWCGPMPEGVEAMEQKSVRVGAWTSEYQFEAGGVGLDVEFASPVTPGNIDRAGTPITRVSFKVRALDHREHEVSVYLDCSAEWCVNTPEQAVRWSRASAGEWGLMTFASQDQPVLAKRGDDLRIDWGTFYVAARQPAREVIASDEAARGAFMEKGELPAADDMRQPRAARDHWPVAAVLENLGSVGAHEASGAVMLGYDAGWAIELFDRKLRPVWRRAYGSFPEALMATAKADPFAGLESAERELHAELVKVGGEKYAQLAELAMRQTMAAHVICADWGGTPLMFPKENFSNGCISTVDVIFPSSPFFLALNPKLLEAQLRPLMEYAASARWKFDFAPHDLGTYPLADGQVYGGGEKTEEDQMPVEETGNMLIMLAAMAKVEGNAEFAVRYWPTLEKWAGYLKEHGLDPENQLCTDDFAGHLAHNANLAIKGIVGLGGYAQLCEMTGRKDAAAEYRKVAESYAQRWMTLADDGDHYRLAYDKPGTWSQKYNLVWDRVLGTGLFPREVAAKEMAFYRTHINKYGLPLDGRKEYAKLDFAVWTACLTGDRGDFEAIADPLYAFADETPDRVPLTDWYMTTTGKCVGFRARSVVGAVFMPVLLEKMAN